MKKLNITFALLFLYAGILMAPPVEAEAMILETNPIVFYDGGDYAPLMNAIHMLETTGIDTLINKEEQAYGGYQIRPNRLKHYNDLTGSSYTLEDCLNIEVSKKIFLYFTNHDSSGRSIPNKSWEQAAKNWNGSGPMTIEYWENVKNLI